MIQTLTSRKCIGGTIDESVSEEPLSSGTNRCDEPGRALTTTTASYYQDPNNTLSIIGTLSEEDTELDAVNRETPVNGTSCSSTYEVRGTTDTSFSWQIRTSGYTIECDDLLIGIEYEVTPLIRRRTVVLPSSNFGAWEDVMVTPVSFIATATTHTIDDAGNPIDLDHISGYEYEITGVNIEKKA